MLACAQGPSASPVGVGSAARGPAPGPRPPPAARPGDFAGPACPGTPPPLAATPEHYDGGLPRYVERELRAFLICGVFSAGFVRCHCDACGHDLLVAFSCGSRSICPSCCGRRMANTAAHLVDRVLPPNV